MKARDDIDAIFSKPGDDCSTLCRYIREITKTSNEHSVFSMRLHRTQPSKYTSKERDMVVGG